MKRSQTSRHPADIDKMANVLCIDLEDYFQCNDVAVAYEDWPRFTGRLSIGTGRILQTLAEHGVHATFFVVSHNAEKDPALVRRLISAGHEVASHTHTHRMLTTMTPDEFRQDLHRSVSILREVTGAQVRGFRAASWSLNSATRWAQDILLSEGIEYDSSIVPCKGLGHVQGDPSAPVTPHGTAAGLIEFPSPVFSVAGLRYPFSLAAAFRLTPYPLLRLMIRWFARRHRSPAMISLHPWDLDPEQPHLRVSPFTRVTKYAGLRNCAAKLDRLLGEFSFVRMDEALIRLGLLKHQAR